jgi:hypothetical protein
VIVVISIGEQMVSYPQSEASIGPESAGVSARAAVVASLTAAVITIIFYWLTAFRTITWWDSGEYALAAITLGVPHPPGSQLAVWLGWIVTKLPLGIPKVFALNCLSGVFAAATIGMVCGLGLGLFRRHQISDTDRSNDVSAVLLGAVAAVASLVFSFGDTLWTLATRFTPYTLTPLLTALIIWCLFRWWQQSDRPDAIRWLAIASLLFGLDFSVHRTNLLLLPGMLVWILLRHPQVLASLRTWLYCAGSFAVGLAFHLITIPIAAGNPAINICDPSNWSRFWSYITLKQYGGGMLINLFPRKAPFFSVQMVDYLEIFGDNFAHFGGTVFLGVLPLILGLIGLSFLWRKERRLAIGTIVLFLCASIVGVIYFNTPAGFFRSMDRHYLPSLLIFTIWIVYGCCALFAAANKARFRYRLLLVAIVGALVLASPMHQVARNHSAVNFSKNYFAIDYARNALNCLPANAIVFSGGDNDTYPLWYAQVAEGLRPDVDILNFYLLNTPWYLEQLLKRRPDFPLKLTSDEIEQLRPIAWHDSTVSIAVRGTPADFALPSETVLPDSIRLQVRPTGGKYIMISDQLVLKMLAENAWERPICLLTTMNMDDKVGLQPYARTDGLYYRIVPTANAPVNSEILAECLLKECAYRGYADSSVTIDPVSKMMGLNYCAGMLQLMHAQAASGDTLACAETRAALKRLLPSDRLDWPESIRQSADQLCSSLSGQAKP